jgi:hypothetical protein
MIARTREYTTALFQTEYRPLSYHHKLTFSALQELVITPSLHVKDNLKTSVHGWQLGYSRRNSYNENSSELHNIMQSEHLDRRFQRPRGLRRRSAAERLLESWVRIPPGAWMFVSCTVFVLSGRGLCDGPIPRPEESYRLWCVSECDQVKINNLATYCE